MPNIIQEIQHIIDNKTLSFNAKSDELIQLLVKTDSKNYGWTFLKSTNETVNRSSKCEFLYLISFTSQKIARSFAKKWTFMDTMGTFEAYWKKIAIDFVNDIFAKDIGKKNYSEMASSIVEKLKKLKPKFVENKNICHDDFTREEMDAVLLNIFILRKAMRANNIYATLGLAAIYVCHPLLKQKKERYEEVIASLKQENETDSITIKLYKIKLLMNMYIEGLCAEENETLRLYEAVRVFLENESFLEEKSRVLRPRSKNAKIIKEIFKLIHACDRHAEEHYNNPFFVWNRELHEKRELDKKLKINELLEDLVDADPEYWNRIVKNPPNLSRGTGQCDSSEISDIDDVQEIIDSFYKGDNDSSSRKRKFSDLGDTDSEGCSNGSPELSADRHYSCVSPSSFFGGDFETKRQKVVECDTTELSSIIIPTVFKVT